MCGICGERTYGRPPSIATIRAMISELGHRGPDGSGCYRDRDAMLGHTRLSIIDAAGGAQPMSNEDGSRWVTFNGEIFNHVELAAQLKSRGHVFRTRSDTEVVVHAWEEWGIGAFPRFNGQWAVAIWDSRRRELVLSRDRFGILPLFHTRVGQRVLFASTVRALFADPEVPRALDPRGMDEVLTLWSTTGARTVFTGIEQVRPGTCLVFGEDGDREPVEHRYWEPRFDQDHDPLRSDLASSARSVREALVEATRLRFLRSDVPVSAYLSGGIDSAVTAGIITRYTDAEVDTYSLRFSDAEFDEGSFQQQVSARLGTRHHDVTVSGSDIAGVFPEVIRHAETPLLRTAPAPMLLLSRLVRESGHRVVVTGEGADEMLAGYDLFREAAVRRFMARDPEDPARARALELLYPWMQRNPNSAPAFARSFFSRDTDPDDPFVSHRPRWGATAALKRMLTVRMSAVPPLDLPSPQDSDRWDPLSRAQWLELTTLLPGYLLSSQGDRMLMANSVEGRYPFLDPDFADVAAAVPARHRLNGLSEKHVLKAAFADLVPDEVLSRPKQPYRAPDAASFVGADAPAWVADVLSYEAVAEAGVFRPEVVTRLHEKARAARGRPLGNTDNMRFVAALSTQLLFWDMIAGTPSRGRHDAPPQVVRDELSEAGDE